MTVIPPTLSHLLLPWYDAHRRDLPWRVPLDAPRGARPSAYHVVVSEAMLQQTQVSTVVPYFERFVQALPDFRALADANEEQVLRLWQGLGYYSRARNLQRTARAIQQDFGGMVPADVKSLLTLPGIGRYTAGAIASITHDTPAPILDGNVVRVLCRLEAIAADPRDRAVQAGLWKRAEEILPSKRVGDFNSALMELGATVCTPRNPSCLLCPVQSRCEAYRLQIQHRIPLPRPARETPRIERFVLCLERADGCLLLERRPPKGRWAGMWQFLTAPEPAWPGITARRLERIGEISHALTHRRYTFHVFTQRISKSPAEGQDNPRRWASFEQMEQLPFPRPHLKIRQLLELRLHERKS